MPAPISVQLYSLREQTKDGKHVDVLKTLAATGFAAVEAAGFYGMKPAEFRTLVESLGMRVSSSHFAGIPAPEAIQELIDTQHALGTPYAVSAWLPPERFATLASITALAAEVEAARAALAKGGVTLLMHNHDFEMKRIDGLTGYDHLARLVPQIRFEIDTYWAANFGAEVPARIVGALKDKTLLLHLKDGGFERGKPMVAAGKGKQDFAAIVGAADPRLLEYVVVELDECATDMTQAVIDSYHYLVGKGLARGTKPAQRTAP